VNKQEFSASSWRSKQGYTKMHGQPTIKTVNTVKCSWWWAKTSPETCRADLE